MKRACINIKLNGLLNLESFKMALASNELLSDTELEKKSFGSSEACIENESIEFEVNFTEDKSLEYISLLQKYLKSGSIDIEIELSGKKWGYIVTPSEIKNTVSLKIVVGEEIVIPVPNKNHSVEELEKQTKELYKMINNAYILIGEK